MKKLNFRSVAFTATLLMLVSAGFTSCDNDDDNDYPEVSWLIPLSTKYETPSVDNRNENGLLTMQLWDDNLLTYKINISNLSSNDKLVGAYLYAGDVITNGDAILNLAPVFSGNYTSGSIQLRSSLADSLKNFSNQIYVNILSEQVQSGLVRGQVNTDIVYTSSVVLSGNNEVPSLTTQTIGTALVRTTREGVATDHRKVYSLITVENIEPGDQLISGGIYAGSESQTGNEFIRLSTGETDFNVNMTTVISKDNAYNLYNNDSYLNVISSRYNNGIIRSQLKNDYKNPLYSYE